MPLDAVVPTGTSGLASSELKRALARRHVPARELTPRTIALIALATVAIVALMMAKAGLALSGPPEYFLMLFAGALMTFGLAPRLAMHSKVGLRIGGDFISYAGLLAFISLAGVIASYPAAFFSGTFRDSQLLAADRALGFNWLALYRLVAHHALLQQIERALYDSVFISPLVLSACFASAREKGKAQLLVGTYWLAVIITLAFSVVLPAKGPLAVLWHGPIPYMPESALYQATTIAALKDHAFHSVQLDHLGGLVGAPSFHTAAAVIFIAAAWPLRSVRWPVVTVNALMLAAIPVEGTHYLIDMVVGALVAIVARVSMKVLLETPADGHPGPKAIASAGWRRSAR